VQSYHVRLEIGTGAWLRRKALTQCHLRCLRATMRKAGGRMKSRSDGSHLDIYTSTMHTSGSSPVSSTVTLETRSIQSWIAFVTCGTIYVEVFPCQPAGGGYFGLDRSKADVPELSFQDILLFSEEMPNNLDKIYREDCKSNVPLSQSLPDIFCQS
jgi:hypothetical protein